MSMSEIRIQIQLSKRAFSSDQFSISMTQLGGWSVLCPNWVESNCIQFGRDVVVLGRDRARRVWGDGNRDGGGISRAWDQLILHFQTSSKYRSKTSFFCDDASFFGGVGVVQLHVLFLDSRESSILDFYPSSIKSY